MFPHDTAIECDPRRAGPGRLRAAALQLGAAVRGTASVGKLLTLRARLLPPRPVLKAAGSEGRAALLAYFHKRRIIEQINSEMSQFQSFEDARSGTSQRK